MTCFGVAQYKDPILFKYTTTTSDAGFNFSGLKISGGHAVTFKKGFVAFNASLETYDFSYGDEDNAWESVTDQQFYKFAGGLNVGYMLTTRLLLGGFVAPVLASDFTKAISDNDFNLNSGLYLQLFWKRDLSKFSYLRFGFVYGTTLGKPQWIPSVTYYLQSHEDLNYTLGFPSTGVHYTWHDKHTFFPNISSKSLFAGTTYTNPGFDQTEKEYQLNFLSFNAGIDYEYHLGNDWHVSAYLGYPLYSKSKLLDGDHTVYEYHTNKSPIVSFGITYHSKK